MNAPQTDARHPVDASSVFKTAMNQADSKPLTYEKHSKARALTNVDLFSLVVRENLDTPRLFEPTIVSRLRTTLLSSDCCDRIRIDFNAILRAIQC
mmetsp:Transcript_109047/g.170512  ORF Transcript_109047/g.170512 Transcript_109047/m.170512 type:complete len:96 (+) Transcript_109047:48-335(+)